MSGDTRDGGVTRSATQSCIKADNLSSWMRPSHVPCVKLNLCDLPHVGYLHADLSGAKAQQQLQDLFVQQPLSGQHL